MRKRATSPFTKTELRENLRLARERGDKTYQGRPCPDGHQGIRHTTNQECVECQSTGWFEMQRFKKNRKDARAQGLDTFEGRPCKYGHVGLRSAATGDCVECNYKRQRRKDWRSRACSTRENKKDHPEVYLVAGARQRARRRGLSFNLHERDIKVPDVCPVLGIPMIPGAVWGERNNAPSLDRVDNSEGYVLGNVEVISLRANTIKGDATIEELEAVLAYMKAHSNS